MFLFLCFIWILFLFQLNAPLFKYKHLFFFLWIILFAVGVNSPLSKYKDIGGAPNTGFHAYSIFGFAAVDVGGVVLLSLGLAFAFILQKRQWLRTSLSIFILVVLYTIPVHMIFGVDTRLLVLLRRLPTF